MESIFHEKQEGSLCAQHCLNNLLQGEYFSPVELSSIAHQLDEEERMRMAEGGVTSEDYRTFLQQPSGNMDDSGFFSIQVISNALKVWGLELILFNSPEYQRLRIDPINERSFICNYKEHWFTVRKLGKQVDMMGGSRNISQDIPQRSGTTLTSEELRKRREAYFEKGVLQALQHRGMEANSDAMSEEDMLQAAVTMSLETVRNNLKTEGKK
ncbi:PREDICTED: ataxin-3 [Propithecus coquereli]|uniref:ataxin-3 n=1 Tax=Propithecus coquereli TaxID=379532 RepID=UPI00063FC66A|nr:PREDICTED: ataxin-3 [Propithecus coquereli]